jgi:DNA-binding NarL/FixJ family response regulator
MMSQSANPIRVLLADDHPLFRRGMRAILGVEPDTELVGEATDGQQALDMALELRPDVILMDLNMPKVSGIEATRRILEANPDTAILMLTMFEDDDSVFAAMRAGAHGSVLKGADGAATLRAIHAVANGEAIFSSFDHAAPDGIFRHTPGSPRSYEPARQGSVILSGGITRFLCMALLIHFVLYIVTRFHALG